MIEDRRYSDYLKEGVEVLGKTGDLRALEYLKGLISNPERHNSGPSYYCDQYGTEETVSSWIEFPDVKEHIGRRLKSEKSYSTTDHGYSGGGQKDEEEYKQYSGSLMDRNGRLCPECSSKTYKHICKAIDKLKAELKEY